MIKCLMRAEKPTTVAAQSYVPTIFAFGSLLDVENLAIATDTSDIEDAGYVTGPP